MRKEQEKIKDFMKKAGQDTPKMPYIPDDKTRALRVQLLLEEVLELAEASGVVVLQTLNEQQLKEIKGAKEGEPVHVAITKKKQNFYIIKDYKEEVDLVEVADALADIEYVNLGAGAAYGLDVQEFFDEVHDSNMTKFVDGYRDETGKWRKGPSFREPDLKQVLKNQKNNSVD
jgi:predicted HAD superfamily Cof-like phosphohydrolase